MIWTSWMPYRMRSDLVTPRACWWILAPLLLILLGCGAARSRGVRANASAAEQPLQQPAMGRHLEAKGVANFGQVTPTLYRGGQPPSQGFESLADLGINIVVDTGRSKRDEGIVKKLGMRYVSLPWYCPLPRDKVFDQFVELVRNNPRKKIYVHCRFGDDRTGMMIAAYRMAEDGWTAKQAMAEMHEFGYTWYHHFMCPGLAHYESSFPHRLKDDQDFVNLR